MEIEFTLHAKEQIKGREIKVEEVIEAIQNPDKIYQEFGKYYAEKDIGRGTIRVVFRKDKYINVITIYWLKIK